MSLSKCPRCGGVQTISLCQCKPRAFKVGDAVQTRDGRRARIICDDAGGIFPLVALVHDHADAWKAKHYRHDGRAIYDPGQNREHSDDLVSAPRTRTVWITWWGTTTSSLGLSELTLETYPMVKTDDIRACIKLEIEEGRFDE